MRKYIGWLAAAALAGFVVVGATTGGEDTKKEDPLSPKETIQNWAKAFASNDAAKVLRFYAESDNLIVILSTGQQYKGFASVKKVYEEGSREVIFSDSEVTEFTAEQLKDVGWVTCRHRLKLRLRADDSKCQLEVRTTLVLTRNKDSWQIVLEHSSPIADVPRLKPLQ